MPFQPYLHVLRIPRVPTSLLLLVCARLPMTAMGVTLTLHVVSELGRGYGAAGLVGTATMAGSAIGSPMLGRMIDRRGLRAVAALSGCASATYWLAAPHLPYFVLLAVTLPAGMLTVPSGSIARQTLAALVPESRRRTAYSVETILTEACFMIGPATGILVLTQVSSTAALSGIGVAFLLAAAGLFWLNPPVRSATETAHAGHRRPTLRSWMSRKLLGTLLTASGALFVLVGTELAALATLRDSGDVAWTGMVIAVMCAASLVGGVVHGAASRSLSQLPLMLLLALLVIPAGLFDQTWWLLAIALIPTNLACAPTLAATTESVAGLAPANVRGEAMGLQDSATRTGLALGSPVVGFVIDHASPAWGFAASGLGGLLIAAVGMLIARRGSAPARERAPAHVG